MAIEGYATLKAMFVPGLSTASFCFEWLNSSINLENYLLEWKKGLPSLPSYKLIEVLSVHHRLERSCIYTNYNIQQQ